MVGQDGTKRMTAPLGVVPSRIVAIIKEIRKWPAVPLFIIGMMVIAGVFADLIAPHDPIGQSLAERYAPPFWQEGGTSKFLLGSDRFGRDVLSRLIFGARVSLVILAATLAVGGAAGLVIGVVSGYMGGRIDGVLMRVVDGFIAMPGILIALLFAVTLGPGIWTVTMAISLFVWASFARVIRGEVLSLKQRDFIALSVVHGCSPMRVMFVHIGPGVLSLWAVLATLNAGGVIISEASLSFLGAGIPPPEPSWGQIISEGRGTVASAWWVAAMPGICITLVVLSVNLFGDWLRDFLDPKLRATR